MWAPIYCVRFTWMPFKHLSEKKLRQISSLHIWKSVEFWQLIPLILLLHKCACHYYKEKQLKLFNFYGGKWHNCITFSQTGSDGNRTCQSTNLSLLEITFTVLLRDSEFIRREDSNDTNIGNLWFHCSKNYKGIQS